MSDLFCEDNFQLYLESLAELVNNNQTLSAMAVDQ